jgi:hypothetical protein
MIELVRLIFDNYIRVSEYGETTAVTSRVCGRWEVLRKQNGAET